MKYDDDGDVDVDDNDDVENDDNGDDDSQRAIKNAHDLTVLGAVWRLALLFARCVQYPIRCDYSRDRVVVRPRVACAFEFERHRVAFI